MMSAGEHLWGNLMAGGAGVEWYFGYTFPHNDLNCENWRNRDHMWDHDALRAGLLPRPPAVCENAATTMS